MKLFNIFGSATQITESSELPEIFPLKLVCDDFTKSDISATFTKILTDTLERTHGIPADIVPLLWDNCVLKNTQFGLVTLLVRAMVSQADLFIVYKKSLKVLRLATHTEAEEIRKDYASKGESEVGTYISFKNYRRTEMLKIYSQLEYGVLSSLHKTVNISRAVQVKMDSLRASVSLQDAGVAAEQARSIAAALRRGSDVLLDVKDEITSAAPDVSPTERAIAFLDAKRAFYLDLPISYISGLQTPGIGSTGEADSRAVERGLKQYFFSIIQPVLKSIFDLAVEFKSQDFRQMDSALQALKDFELVSDQLLSAKSKKDILARMFDVDPDAEEKQLNAEAKERGSDTTLNGAQVSAMGQFLEQLAAGTLAPETAITALMVSFNLSEDDAIKIVKPMQTFKPRAVAGASK